MSEGGLAVAIAEMCIAGGLGASLPGHFDEVELFSESNSRFIIEVEPKYMIEIESLFQGFPIHKLGTVVKESVLAFDDLFSIGVDELKTAWQKPLDW